MNDEFAINDRIAHLISEYGLTNADFAKKLGVPASSISHLLAKRNKPGLNFIMSLLEQYKDIDANWLLTGVRSSRAMARSVQDGEAVVEQDLFSSLDFNAFSKRGKLFISALNNNCRVVLSNFKDNIFRKLTYDNKFI